MSKVIPISCDVKDFLTIFDITPMQGNLKERSPEQIEKLKAQIIENGFSFPFFVWKDGETNYTIDGHGRDIAVRELIEDGYSFEITEGAFGYLLPVVYIHADNRVQAKKKLLALNSGFGKITEAGLFEFINEEGYEIPAIELEGLEVIGIDIENFMTSMFDEPGFDEEGDAPESGSGDEPENYTLQIGEYKKLIPADVFHDWEERVKLEGNGSDKDSIMEEILRRLEIQC